MPTEKPDALAFAAAIRDLARAGQTFTMLFDPLELMNVIGLVQLALRHPLLPASTVAAGRKWLTDCRAILEPVSPVLAAVFDAGNDPGQDEPFCPVAPWVRPS